MWVIQGIGSGIEHDYAGVVEDTFKLRVGDSVKFVLSSSWGIEHQFPLILFGADIFFGVCGALS